MDAKNSALYKRILGCLLGGLIGDAMGAPVEGWDYRSIAEAYGEVADFSGEGTDDSLIKGLLCKALIEHDGEITADEFAQAFLDNITEKDGYPLLYIPVKNMYHKIQDNVCLPVAPLSLPAPPRDPEPPERASKRPPASTDWMTKPPKSPDARETDAKDW